jgi:hypothetical protein
MRLAARRDSNEQPIIEALLAIGVVVYRVSQPGLPDLLVWDPHGRAVFQGKRYFWLPIEVKELHGRLTPLQVENRIRSPFPVVESVDDALALFGVYTRLERGLKQMAKAQLRRRTKRRPGRLTRWLMRSLNSPARSGVRAWGMAR